jgi:ribosomal protein L40E
MSTKKRATKLKVMHHLDKDKDGNNTIHSILSNPPKLREAVGTDKVQQAEETAHKTPKKDASKNEMTEEQREVLQALHDLGGKDMASMDIAKKLGFDKKFPDAPRAPVRNAMERLHELHYVTSKEAGSAVKPAASKPPASNPGPSERPANTDIQCPKCNTFNPFGAEFCKECGAILRPVQAVAVAA